VLFFQAEDGIRDRNVTGVQTCALPICLHTSVGFALVGAVVGEYLASAQGLGWIISQAQGNFDAAGVYAGMLILCVVVVIVEFMRSEERRVGKEWRLGRSA